MSLWNPWVTVRNTILVSNSDKIATTSTSNPLTTLKRTDIPFPYIYTPARAYWLRSLINNCTISWRNPGDLLTNYMMSGGAGFTLVSSLAAMATIANDDYFSSKIWGFGYSE